MRSKVFWKKPQAPTNVMLGRTCFKRSNFPTASGCPQTYTILKKTLRVGAMAVVVHARIQHDPPHTLTKCSTVTSVPTFSTKAILAITNVAQKSLTSLVHEGLVRSYVNMGNNKFVE